ncbi:MULTISPECIES: HNH endonuclease signature motif containing protein [unclassified Coleofasciculus]|uniref:HNH endonuclease n=1 Tax=unclassified Coleofasciculus TaxID=2692782 RepID=UPI002AD3A629|nr:MULTISPECIES: HNH endonuclease signature motif containing protein [unclassified Coleofasciculus]
MKQKEAIARRAGGCCEYCRSQARFSPDPFSIEHIIPRSKNGTDEDDNLALACQGCNNRKYTHVEARDPVSGNNGFRSGVSAMSIEAIHYHRQLI